MGNQSQVIREQMLHTRQAMSEKLGMLEQHVAEKVEHVTNAVVDTADTVNATIHSVTDSVHNTVEVVKDTCDVRQHVKRHPWSMLAGAAALGYVGAAIVRRNARHRSAMEEIPYVPAGAALYREAPQSNGLMGKMSGMFQGEIASLKGMAIGTAMGIVRDLAANQAPTQYERPITEVLNGLTMRLGGYPIQGPILTRRKAERRFDENASGHAEQDPM